MFRSLRPALSLITISIACMAAPALAAPGDTIADGVLGQANLSAIQPNAGGGDMSPIAASLFSPRGVPADQTPGRMYVADSSNNCVLSWPTAAAFTNGQGADIVLGQSNF